MTKNPFRTIRKTMRYVGYTLAGLWAAAILGLFGFGIFQTAARDGWGAVLNGFAVIAAVFVGAFGICVLAYHVAYKWRQWEAAYAQKQRKKLFDAGTPELDPQPLTAGGIRTQYFYPRSDSSYFAFLPREYYDQNEENYQKAYDAAHPKEEDNG